MVIDFLKILGRGVLTIGGIALVIAAICGFFLFFLALVPISVGWAAEGNPYPLIGEVIVIIFFFGLSSR